MTEQVTTDDSSIDSAASALGAGFGAIVFDGKRFVEAKPHGNTPPNYACDGCAFLRKQRYCESAIEYKAKAAFGGDCDERDVIYVEAPNVEHNRRPQGVRVDGTVGPGAQEE